MEHSNQIKFLFKFQMLISISNSKNGFQLIVSIVVYARGYFAETIDVIEQHSIGEKKTLPVKRDRYLSSWTNE